MMEVKNEIWHEILTAELVRRAEIDSNEFMLPKKQAKSIYITLILHVGVLATVKIISWVLVVWTW